MYRGQTPFRVQNFYWAILDNLSYTKVYPLHVQCWHRQKSVKMENLGKKYLRFIEFDSLLSLDRTELEKMKH